MSSKLRVTRRDFLTASTTVAALGLTAGTTHGQNELKVVAGPKPKKFAKGERIRIGLIGCGGRMRQLLMHTLPHKNVDIVAVAEPDQKNLDLRLAEIAEDGRDKPDIYRGETDYRDKLMARDDIAAVIIATPVYMHARMYLEAFAAGKHFYGEKPMCITVRDADLICQAQERNPEVIAQIGFQRRASHLYVEGIKAIHNGMIGEVMGCYAAWNVHYGPLGLPGTDSPLWWGRRAMSGDWMLEQACHTWDVINWVAQGLPVEAEGMGRKDIWTKEDPDRDVTDFYFAHIKYKNGMLVDFEHCFFSPDPKWDEQCKFREVFERFIGPKGGIALQKHESISRFYPRFADGKPVVIATDVDDRTDQYSVDAFYKTLAANARPPATVYHGRDATKVGLLVRMAVDRGGKATMEEVLAQG